MNEDNLSENYLNYITEISTVAAPMTCVWESDSPIVGAISTHKLIYTTLVPINIQSILQIEMPKWGPVSSYFPNTSQ